MHISTLRYRLERIEALLETTLEDQASRFEKCRSQWRYTNLPLKVDPFRHTICNQVLI
ncbi:helix-turn-helix domain-containing protein [Cupriavidus basilensis]